MFMSPLTLKYSAESRFAITLYGIGVSVLFCIGLHFFISTTFDIEVEEISTTDRERLL